MQRIEQEIVFISEEWHGYFIAEMNGKIVGAIGGGMNDDTVGEVYVFYLDPTLRGQGIGTRFLTSLRKFKSIRMVPKNNGYLLPKEIIMASLSTRHEDSSSNTKKWHTVQ